ncbi:MAG: hypothetical protein JWP12_120 [Bacteroidetes bacterium]|nr:hypothetical protein [Bacteroidota bacterium]
MQEPSTATIPPPWLNFLNRKRASDSTALFYDPATLEWAAGIEQQWEILRDEILEFLEANSHELKSFYAGQQKWKSFGLYAWGMSLSEERCKKCKKTIEILKKLPGLVTIMVGVMEPHSKINGHRGDTDAIYRCHLPLVVPGTLPEIGFQVEEEKKSWVNGKLMVFNDAQFHQAWNDTDQRRVVLIFDVIKPEYRNRTMDICSKVLSSLAIQKAAQKFPLIAGMPRIILWPLHYLLLSKLIRLNLWYKKGTSKSLL